jgi:hypothetical protein
MQALAKVAPKRDAVDVHEHRILADIVGEFDREGSGLSLGVSSPVANENPAHFLPLRTAGSFFVGGRDIAIPSGEGTFVPG